jgi:hypothetical protein
MIAQSVEANTFTIAQFMQAAADKTAEMERMEQAIILEVKTQTEDQ